MQVKDVEKYMEVLSDEGRCTDETQVANESYREFMDGLKVALSGSYFTDATFADKKNDILMSPTKQTENMYLSTLDSLIVDFRQSEFMSFQSFLMHNIGLYYNRLKQVKELCYSQYSLEQAIAVLIIKDDKWKPLTTSRIMSTWNDNVDVLIKHIDKPDTVEVFTFKEEFLNKTGLIDSLHELRYDDNFECYLEGENIRNFGKTGVVLVEREYVNI